MYLLKHKLFLTKVLLTILLMFLCSFNVWTQEFELQINGDFPEELSKQVNFDFESDSFKPENKHLEKLAVAEITESTTDFADRSISAFSEENAQELKDTYGYFLTDKAAKKLRNKEEFIESSFEISSKYEAPKQSLDEEKFHWKPALVESLYLIGIQHGYRTIQKKTRREFDGKFFNDWGKSVKNLGGWRDGDNLLTNYIAHPMQGAATGRIFINNSDKFKKLEFGRSKQYWESRFKAMAWSAVWSLQFELGPLSEASIGNVGLYDDVGPNRMAWVDIVVTPSAGTGVLIGEDFIDKYVLKKWLEKGNSRTRIKLFRTFFTPIHSFTNVLGGKTPWHRDNR